MTWKDVAPALRVLTTRLRFEPENPFSENQGFFHKVVKERSYKGPSEGALHELGHAVILGLLTTNERGPRMKDNPTQQIDDILRRRKSKVSDDHEVYVLAVEKRFADKLGLVLGTNNLVSYAFMSFRYYKHEDHYKKLVARVNKLAAESVVVARHTRRLIKILKREMISLKKSPEQQPSS